MVPLNLGIRAHDLSFDTVEELAVEIKNNHLRHVQLAIKKTFPQLAPNLSAITHGTASYLGDTLQAAGVKISVLGCYVDLSNPDVSIRQQATADFCHHLTLANDFHASVVGTELGKFIPNNSDTAVNHQAREIIYPQLEQMVLAAEKSGAIIGLEGGTNHPFSNLESIQQILKDFPSPNLKIIYDPVNLLTPKNFQQQKIMTQTALATLGNKIAVIHLKDFTFEQGKLRSVPIGTGLMDFTDLMTFAKISAPLIPCSLENIKKENVTTSITYLQELYQNS